MVRLNCGAPTHPRDVDPSVRVVVFIAFLLLCIFMTVLGALVELKVEEAKRINEEVKNLEEAVKSVGLQVIFGNNFMHALVMFVPVFGVFWGLFVLYSTGMAIAAISLINRINPVSLTLALFIFPFTWMEYISYALAMSESIFLTYSMFKRKLTREFNMAAKLIVLCSVILLIAALIETLIISFMEVAIKV